jgi:hypothetical protein
MLLMVLLMMLLMMLLPLCLWEACCDYAWRQLLLLLLSVCYARAELHIQRDMKVLVQCGSRWPGVTRSLAADVCLEHAWRQLLPLLLCVCLSHIKRKLHV